MGPVVLGAAEDADVDILLDEPTVSGRHIRLEVVPCGKGKHHREFRSAILREGFAWHNLDGGVGISKPDRGGPSCSSKP